MNFVKIARIGRLSAAIIDSAAQRKLNICKRFFVKHRKERLTQERTMADNWERLAFALSWESRFYRQGLQEGFGIRGLFDELFELEGEDPGPDWDEVIDLGVLRCLTFTTDPGQDIRYQVPYRKEEIDLEDENNAHRLIEQYLLEEIRRGVALANWTDSQITDKEDHHPVAVQKWDQIINQAHQFYSYAGTCEGKIGHTRENLNFKSQGGVFAIHPDDIPAELELEVLDED